MGFYERLKDKRGDDDKLEQCIRNTVRHLKTTSTERQRPGMLLGKIQSGKTRGFLGVMALAFDEGFDVAIVLTKGTKTLAKQTVERISSDFEQFRNEDAIQVYDIMSVPALSNWEVEEHKLVFVVKKEYRNLERLMRLYQSTQPMLLIRKTLIIDDEADFASIRFAKKRGQDEIEQGRIADQMDDLRRLLTNAAFLQVTATPYSLYLQPDGYPAQPGANFTYEPKRPAFTELLPIHSAYVGGDHYFGEHTEGEPEYYLWYPVDDSELVALKKEDRRRVKTDEILTTPRVEALRHGLVSFIVGAIIRRRQQQETDQRPSKYAMIVHVETARASHSWQETVVGEILDALKVAVQKERNILNKLLEGALNDLSQSIEAAGLNLPDYKYIYSEFCNALNKGGVVVEKVNSDNDVMALLDENAELKLRTPYNIFIGGQILDRGITIPNLISFYYGRSPKKMQQDTVLQHSRMYGARPKQDLAVTRFFTTPANFQALSNIHEFDSALRYAFEVGAHDRGVAFVHKDSTNRVVPCAPSKILLSNIRGLRPGGRWLPIGFQSRAKTHIHKTVERLDELILGDSLSETEVRRISLKRAVEIVELIEETLVFNEIGYQFDWNSYRAAIEYFSRIVAPKPEADHVYILSATNRSITRQREGGRFSDAPDTKQQASLIQASAQNIPALVLLRQNGEKESGWGGAAFWWPVLFAPMKANASVFTSSVSEQ